MKRALLWIAAGLVLVILVLAILPFVISVDTYRGAIERAAHDATGRTLKIAGPMRLTIFPEIGIAAEDVHFSNMAGGHAPDMASIGAMRLSVATLPLLTGKIRVSSITLDQPVINLEADAQGRTNWTFARQTDQGQTSRGLPKGLSFSGIDITNGEIHYTDDATAKSLSLEALNLHADLTTLDAPASVKGDLVYAAKKIDIEGRVETLQSLSEGAATKLALSLKSELLNASFDGALAPDRSLSGSVNAGSPSARKLGAWLGKEMPAGGGLGKMEISGKIAHSAGLTEFSGLKLALDQITATGSLSVETGGVRPRVTGQLAAGHLDLNPYMQMGGGAAAPAAAPAKGWSTAPIAVDALRLVDADLSFNAQSLVIRKFSVGKTALHVVLNDGVLQANLNPMTLYGGGGSARIGVDAHGRVPDVTANLSFDNVSMGSLLNDMLGVNKIEGVGKLELNVSGTGASADAIMHALTGKGSVTIANGRIRGVNLGMVARTVKTALSGDATGDGASTDFTQMGGSFVIAKGVMTNNDFSLTGPVISATGKGTIDIGNQTIDFLLSPKADVAVANVTVPFRIRGPWTKPSYVPDLAGLASGVVQGLANGQGAGGLLGGLLGGGKSTTTTDTQQQKKSSPGDFLGGLLGR
ncbi:MAG: AsmA family protein [Alphaproteobacteria bacterium]|nr:AsmA family protein [Alphaproteobacteria bacterium]